MVRAMSAAVGSPAAPAKMSRAFELGMIAAVGLAVSESVSSSPFVPGWACTAPCAAFIVGTVHAAHALQASRRGG